MNQETNIPKKMMKFLLKKLGKLGCNGSSSLPVSAPVIIRSAAKWESKNTMKRNKKRRKPSSSRRNQGNIVVDVPYVCCVPPGIGIGSDFVPRSRKIALGIDHRKNSRVLQRNKDSSHSNPAILTRCMGSRTYRRATGEITETMMLRQNLLSGRPIERYNEHEDWMLNIDDMSYEELVDLGDKIGYVETGLPEEEISSCIKKYKSFNLFDSSRSTAENDWRCSICQEKCRDDEIGALECGHYHHVGCIKQWLLLKNACPVCKSAAIM